MPGSSANTPNTSSQQNTENDVKALITKLLSLILALEAHPQMNKSSPKDSPKSLFFTWDFVQRTRHNLSQIPIPALASKEPKAMEQYNDALGRCMMSQMIISDRSGKTTQMMTQGQAPVDFGPVVREKAEALV